MHDLAATPRAVRRTRKDRPCRYQASRRVEGLETARGARPDRARRCRFQQGQKERWKPHRTSTSRERDGVRSRKIAVHEHPGCLASASRGIKTGLKDRAVLSVVKLLQKRTTQSALSLCDSNHPQPEHFGSAEVWLLQRPVHAASAMRTKDSMSRQSSAEPYQSTW
jgi:hypothetical protein